MTTEIAQVFVCDWLAEMFGEETPITVAEIGVWQGDLSKMLLERIPAMQLLMVDSWKAGEPESDYWKSEDAAGPSRATEQDMATSLAKAKTITEFAKERRIIIVSDSVLAASMCQDESLDAVFIDGDHTLEGVFADLCAWVPKVRRCGLIMGHDYGPYENSFHGVDRAIAKYRKTSGIGDDLELGIEECWKFTRPPLPEW